MHLEKHTGVKHFCETCQAGPFWTKWDLKCHVQVSCRVNPHFFYVMYLMTHLHIHIFKILKMVLKYIGIHGSLCYGVFVTQSQAYLHA